MNPLKKGPELKLPPLKAPAFLVDLYHDLRERHLLPLAVLLVVAIVAVPIVLSDSTEPEESGSASVPGATATTSGAVARSGALVAESAPGLRDYHRRLDGLDATDPFKQQYAGKESETTESTTTTESPTGTTEYPEGGGGGGTGVTHKLTYYSYAIDVRVSGGAEGSKATVRRNLPELTMLPSRETPAIIYMGSTKDGKKALMLISSDVEAIFGDAKCVLGSQTCELLAMEVGLPETFVYGGAGKTYKIELLKIGLVESDKLNKAPLGDPKRGKGGGNRPAYRAAARP